MHRYKYKLNFIVKVPKTGYIKFDSLNVQSSGSLSTQPFDLTQYSTLTKLDANHVAVCAETLGEATVAQITSRFQKEMERWHKRIKETAPVSKYRPPSRQNESHLRDVIYYTIEFRPLEHRIIGQMIAPKPYAVFLEFGTSKMDARPFMRKSFKETIGQWLHMEVPTFVFRGPAEGWEI